MFTDCDNVLPAMPEKDYRALLTEREREILTGQADVNDSYRYRVISRVRKKIDQLESDMEILQEHHDDLYDDIQTVVCDSG